MTRRNNIIPLLADIKNSPCAHLNPHLFETEGSKAPKSGKSKYGSKKAVVDGITFDSKKEANRYFELKMLLAFGEITDLRLQVPFQLTACKYYADFVYIRNGNQVVEDVKSPATRKLTPYRMKKRMMKELFNIEISEV